MALGKEQNQRIHELMLSEISEKNIVGGIVFGSFAIMVFFYGLGLEKYLFPLRVACVCVIAAAVLRYFASRSDKKNMFWFWFKLRAAVWLNAICWSSIFTMVALELNFVGIHSVIAMAIMAYYLTGSVVTLSGDKWLFFPFHVIMLTPILVISLLSDNKDHFILAGFLLFILFFIVGLSIEYRRLLRKRFAAQLELEESLSLLKEQTAQLVQTSKLAAVGEMAGGMAHEINNPLAIIALITKRMMLNLKKETPDHSQDEKLLLEVENTVMRISKIIKGLRNVSRGAASEEMKDVLFSEIFDDVFGICSEKFRTDRIALELIDQDRIVHTPIKCRRVQLSQVLINLISNSYDAVISQSDSKWVHITLRKGQHSLLIEVSNSGPAITEETRNKIFQPFFTTKEIGTGTGLGLSISKKIIEAHGGEISLAENTEHTTFIIRLPAL